MEQLLGDKASTIDSSFIRELFLQRLPGNVRMVLASTGTGKNVNELATLADQIMDVATPSISAVASFSQPNNEVSNLRTEVEELRKLVERLVNKPPRYRSSSRPRTPHPRSPSPAPLQPSAVQTDVCWYHQRYGSEARKCRSPCTQSENFQASR